MAMTIQEKRERRNELARDTRNLLDKTTGPSDWGEEQQATYDANIAEIESLDADIAREQKLLDLEAEQTFEQMGGRQVETGEPSPVRGLFQKWMRGGDNALSADDWTQVRNTLSTGTNTEGGYTVPTEVAETVLEALAAYGGMRQVANVITTSGGGAMQFPTSDGTSEEGEIVDENASATDADPTFGVKDLSVYKFSSKVITVPIELLQDSAVDVEAFVRGRIEQRLGRITNRMFTTGAGSGSSQPNGVITAAGVGKTGGSGQTTTVTYEDLVDLEHSVDPAYRNMGRSRWMMHDSSVKVVRKLKDNDGRPLFLPSYDAGIRGGVPAELMGYPMTINQDVPEMAADAKSIAFGDFTYYTIRDVMAMTMFRFTDSAYAKKGQVGFMAWLRSGGNLIDVGGAVKLYQNSAT